MRLIFAGRLPRIPNPGLRGDLFETKAAQRAVSWELKNQEPVFMPSFHK